MSIYKYQQGIGSVGAYQVSGTPHLTGTVVENGDGSQDGSQIKVSFPKVSISLQIVNTGSAPLLLHFDDRTVAPALIADHNYLVVPSDLTHNGSGSLNNYASGSFRNQPINLNVKCKDVYVSSANAGQSGFQIAAELTSIPATDMIVLSGSGINGDGAIA